MVFGIFSKDRALQRTIDKANSLHGQSADRWAALEKLAKDGSPDALHGLFKRFAFAYDKTIEDQQEKQWVVDTLAGKGDAAFEPLRRYVKSADALGYPLTVLGRIADGERVLLVIDEILAREEPGYTRDPQKKIDTIGWLGEWSEAPSAEAIAKRVAPYLADFDEGVRFKAAETLTHKPHPVAAPALVAALVRPEEESKRLKLRCAEILAAHELELGEHKAAVTAMLETVLADYKLHHDKLARR